jgi:hypothetical protein
MLTCSQALFPMAFFRLDKHVAYPDPRNATFMNGLLSSTSSGVGDGLLGDGVSGSNEVAADNIVDADLSSVSHISQRCILGWFMKVQTGHEFLLDSGADSLELGVLMCMLAGLSTPHS